MVAQSSEELMLDHEAVSRALKAPRAAQFSSGVRTKYSLEDRLPGAGTLGSIVPLSERHLEAMRPSVTPVPGASSRPRFLAFVLVVLAAVTGGVVYRDMHHEPPPAPAAVTE